jgi:hypothetical protein
VVTLVREHRVLSLSFLLNFPLLSVTCHVAFLENSQGSETGLGGPSLSESTGLGGLCFFVSFSFKESSLCNMLCGILGEFNRVRWFLLVR